MSDFITLLEILKELTMVQIMTIGMIACVLIVLWQSPNIINAINNWRKTSKELQDK